MKCIDNIENTIIINKSKFITNLFFVNNIDEVNEKLNYIRNKYKDATHHCYAYIIDSNKRFNDDNEPTGTAGKPILEVLEKNELNYVLCIVTRYFGGIKLGASNLLRAYSNSAKDAINLTNKHNIINGYKIIIEFNYELTNYINNLVNTSTIINKEYNNTIKYTLYVNNTTLNKLENNNISIIYKEDSIIKE